MTTIRMVIALSLLFSVYNVNSATFGPKTEAEEEVIAVEAALIPRGSEYLGPKFILAIPILDPGIPDNPKDYEKEDVWPELRKAESVRSALKLKEALDKTEIFGKVLVVSDTSVSADLFLLGRIEKSNGEDFQISLELYDTTGKRLLRRKKFNHRVTERQSDNATLLGVDPFDIVYIEAADAIGDVLIKIGKNHNKVVEKNQKYLAQGKESKIRMSDLDQLVMIRQLLFARSLSPALYGETVEEKKEKWELSYLPQTDDEEWGRVQAVKAADDKFLEHAMSNYSKLATDIDVSYIMWQKDSFPIAKETRELKNKANAQMILGVIGAVAGAAVASNGGNSSAARTAGVVAATAGVVSVSASFKSRDASKQQAAQLDELGNSVQGVLSPKIIEMQNRQVELSGTATEQLAQWRTLLKEIYDDTSVDPSAIDIIVNEEVEESTDATDQVTTLM